MSDARSDIDTAALRSTADLDARAGDFELLRQAADEIDRLRARIAAVEAERDRWAESARMFCQNADYWRERAEAAEARLPGSLPAVGDELRDKIAEAVYTEYCKLPPSKYPHEEKVADAIMPLIREALAEATEARRAAAAGDDRG